MATKSPRKSVAAESHSQIAQREDDDFHEQYGHLSELIRTKTVSFVRGAGLHAEGELRPKRPLGTMLDR
jgi:hypothetical protein